MLCAQLCLLGGQSCDAVLMDTQFRSVPAKRCSLLGHSEQTAAGHTICGGLIGIVGAGGINVGGATVWLPGGGQGEGLRGGHALSGDQTHIKTRCFKPRITDCRFLEIEFTRKRSADVVPSVEVTNTTKGAEPN